MATKTLLIDTGKQQAQMANIVTRRGESGEMIEVSVFTNGTKLTNLTNVLSKVRLKGNNPKEKYITLSGVVLSDRLTFTINPDWNADAGDFKLCYVELEWKTPTGMVLTSHNVKWHVLQNATISGGDEAHYIDELQQVIDALSAEADRYLKEFEGKFTDVQARLDQINKDLSDTADAIISLFNVTNNNVANLQAKVDAALKKFEDGNFYTKLETDAKFTTKVDWSAGQAFKLTGNINGAALSVPNGVTSFLQLSNYAGYFYVTQAQAVAMTDQAQLPVDFRNSGLWVYQQIGTGTNVFRYQEIRVNNINKAKIAFRNTNGSSTSPWEVIGNVDGDFIINKQGEKVDVLTELNFLTTPSIAGDVMATQNQILDRIKESQRIYVYKEKSLPNYGKNWAGVDATQCRIEFKRVGNRVTMNLRINVSDINKFLGDGGGTMDEIYTIPVGFRMEASVPYYNTPITTGQWAFSHTAPLNYSGIVQQTGTIRWTTAKTGNHYLTATYFTEDPFPSAGALGGGQVKIMNANTDGSIEFGADW